MKNCMIKNYKLLLIPIIEISFIIILSKSTSNLFLIFFGV